MYLANDASAHNLFVPKEAILGRTHAADLVWLKSTVCVHVSEICMRYMHVSSHVPAMMRLTALSTGSLERATRGDEGRRGDATDV